MPYHIRIISRSDQELRVLRTQTRQRSRAAGNRPLQRQLLDYPRVLRGHKN